MESEVLKAICASQGSVETDFLTYNLDLGDSTNEIVKNQEKFALCCPFGQQKVVARTKLTLCRVKDCQGACQRLHLCKNFLFTGSCPYTQRRRGCIFSHELHSARNEETLRLHELETLSRTELCTLLLQCDYTLLPPLCIDYNKGNGEFGLCKKGQDCERLHICERHLNLDCNCFRVHDFSAPQPLNLLREKGVPDTLIFSLKPVYANKSALRFHDRGGNSAAANNTEARGRGRGRGGNRGGRGNRGNRGNRGKRGNQGNPQQQRQTSCNSDSSDPFDGCDDLDLYTDGGSDLSSSTNLHTSAAAAKFDSHSGSDGGPSREQTQSPSQASTDHRGRGGNRGDRGNHQQLPRTTSNDLFAAVGAYLNSDDGPTRRERQRPTRDKTEICMYFIKGHCIHEERCFKAHHKMPYMWEVREDDKWTALPDNETIEKDYCDPTITYSGNVERIHFDTMTRGVNKVRRLSTINALLQPDFIHTTQWLWFWEDEFGKWNIYAATAAEHKQADMSSDQLEQKFLENDQDVVEFTAGSQAYSLSFPDMIQTNKRYGTKRLVKRLPKFVSAADVRTARVRRPVASFTTVPDHWDKTQIPQTGYKRIPLQRSSDEFNEIETLFCKTMRGFDIVKIERIQNKALWEVFQWQKNQMKGNNAASNVTEKKLFHGTDSKHVDVICHTNFDWRLCGTHGTAFGKGSYFARDAKYSHNYTGYSDSVQSMFIARVLAGHYTKGSPDFVRPPCKDGGDINFYDSCVDKVLDPSIFVVFEKHQIYPEYLLQYKTSGLPNSFTASVPARKPAPAPVPRPAPQSRVSINQPSTASYQPSTSSYNSTRASYQPSTTSFLPSTVPYSTVSNQYPNTTTVSPPRPLTPPFRPSPSPKAKPDKCIIC